MLHARKTSNLIGLFTRLLCSLFFASVLGILPISAEAQCSTGWDASGMWSISQRGQKERIGLNLQQNGRVLTGTASILHEETPWTGGITSRTITATVDGTIEGDNLSIQIFWPDNLTGVYNAKVLPSGRLDGETYDKNNSKIRQTWNSHGVLKCLPVATRNLKPSTKTSSLYKGPQKLEPRPSPVSSAPVSSGPGKSSPPPPRMKVPGIVASQVVYHHPYALSGFVVLTWDAGPDHPYAEVWYKVNSSTDIFLVELGKGMRQMPVERGKYYTYILTDAGKTLATVTFAAN